MTYEQEKSSANHTSVADYIKRQIGLCNKSQIKISREVGFPKPNIITMIKLGDTKLPLEKIGRFAEAIEVDPIHLFMLCMSEYYPDTWSAIQRLIGQPLMTLNELEIISTIRESKVINPKVHTEEEKQRLLEVINTFRNVNDFDA